MRFRTCSSVAALSMMCLGACEYDARLSLNPPDWAPEPESAVRLAGACVAGGELTLAFALIDDRGAPLAAAAQLELPSGASVVVGPETLAASLSGATLTPLGGGEPVAVADGALGGLAFAPAAGPHLAVIVEASSRAAEEDPDDERVRAAELAAREHLLGDGARVAVYALLQGVLDERLPFSTDPSAVASAVAAVAGVEGGDAPVLDGLVGVAADLRAASTTGGAMLLVGTSLAERGSQASLDDARAVLAGAPPTRLYAVGLTGDEDVRSLACGSGGATRAVGPEGVVAAALDLAAAARGTFSATASLPSGLAPGPYRLAGELEIELARSERRAIPIALELDFAP